MLLDPRLTQEQYAERVKLFRREASTSAQLQDANTVRIYDFGVAVGGAPYLVMELLQGEDLAEYLQREGRLPV